MDSKARVLEDTWLQEDKGVCTSAMDGGHAILATIQRRPENGDDYFGHHAARHNCSLDEASKLASMDIASTIATSLVMLYVPIRGLTDIPGGCTPLSS